MARLDAGQAVRIIAIGSFWCPAASGGPVDRPRKVVLRRPSATAALLR
jgi:hypothetical protein